MLVFFGIIGALAGAYSIFVELSRYAFITNPYGLAQAIGLFIASLLLVAGGEALVRLADISRHSRNTLSEMQKLVDHVTKPPVE